MGGLSFYMGDLYPTYPVTTRLQTVAEPEDQQALVDNQELAKENPAKQDPASNKNIWVSIGIVFLVVFLLAKF